MKAIVLKGYPDKVTKKFYKKDTIVDFEKNRIKELMDKGIVEIYKEPKPKSESPEISD